MSDPYVGEIRMFAGTFAPEGWADCNGQLLAISKNSLLFHVIGTTYGGDGVSTFALPNLQGRLPLGTGTALDSGRTYSPGERGGANEVTLTLDELPVHRHALVASRDRGRESTPENRLLADGWDVSLFADGALTTRLDHRAVDPEGGPIPHSNEMPYLVIRFVIALDGIFPIPG
jgi:microcystin-dependent protein